MTKKEKKQEAIRKHNERFEYLKANPKSAKEVIQEAVIDVLKSIR